MVYASLMEDGQTALFYLCSQCRLPVTFDHGVWRSTEV
jgi:hypothetical protein